MPRDWSQVDLGGWMTREEVDPEVDPAVAVVGYICEEAAADGSPWQWRVDLSEEDGSHEIIADGAKSEEEARQFTEIAMDQALTSLREQERI